MSSTITIVNMIFAKRMRIIMMRNTLESRMLSMRRIPATTMIMITTKKTKTTVVTKSTKRYRIR